MYTFLRNLNWAPISSWDDLEKIIIALHDPQSRGKAFEEFCHAYFCIQKDLYQAQQVWRYADTPTDLLKKKLGSSTHQDEGIDGIILHYDGTVTAYQAKFRTSRNDIPSQRELSTFYMVSDRADYRLVISNVEDLPRSARERKAHGQILVEDLLELDKGFFGQIHEYVNAGHATQASPITPKPFQEEAICSITKGLSEHTRGQAILACGSGKTLIGKWVVDRHGANTVLVMVPSLALIRQTLAEWHRSGTHPFRYLCVCSDETVDYRLGDDMWEILPSETDVRVTTNPSVLVSFLEQQESTLRVVFSTYQSSSEIVKAFKDPKLANCSFDLTICDEAHRVVGEMGRQFSQVLHENQIPSKKRLFMTATPKVVSPQLAKRESADADPGPIIFSMDDHNIFGPELYRFTFGQAIEQKIICDYRVLIIGVHEEEIARLVRSKGAVQLDDLETWQAESLAQRVALGKAIATYGIKKVFCFHNRVQSAARFVDARLPDSFPSVLNKMKPDLDYVALHIQGEMSTATRSRIMREFRMSPRGVVSNARCLGEGVNVPVVDAVFFADPRRSVIDIVQATGRALRQSPGKDRAYIIIPVLVKEDEDPEAILEDSRFDVVWKVLSAMASQDERLDIAIREARIKQGEGKLSLLGSQDLPSPRDLPDCNAVLMGFPTRIAFSRYQSLLTLEMIEKIGERWHLRFGALKKYMEQYGEEPRADTVFEGVKIGAWLNAQRTSYKKGKLPDDREELLDQLGVHWNVYKDTNRSWLKLLAACSNYYEATGKLPASDVDNEEGLKIGLWLTHQRRRYKKGSMPQERIELFEKFLGKTWDPVGERWERNFAAYKDYVEKNGKQPERRTIHNGLRIGNWLCNAIRPHKDKFSAGQIARLDALGIRWARTRDSTRPSRKAPLDTYIQTLSGRIKDLGETIEKQTPSDEWLLHYEQYRTLLVARERGGGQAGPLYKGDRLLESWFEEQRRLLNQGILSPDKRLLMGRLVDFKSFLEEKRNPKTNHK